ncbi:hypothetical protein QBC38DRAFT_529662 [Podospora fimiseda]|uniref:WSC domain-containing protein n=1 Tax=Podospora fimiseda TaxID=252190 RepID=A0AAN7GW18_9PEZI|nr:hypothetical protein QBC38DRAFT_529662 [Podospora fimiseda]
MYRSSAVIWSLLSCLVGTVSSQNVECITLSEGCDAGPLHETVLQAAIDRFEEDAIYGGRQGVFSSSINEAGTLAQIAYTCQDGSVPPPITGATARDLLSRVLGCPNRCGGVSLANNARCGFGVLIASNADAESCFSGAIDKTPEQSTPSVKASVGTFVHRACRTDQEVPRALSGGSAQSSNMTVEACLELARGFRYAGVEYSTECYWGNEISSASVVAIADQCNIPCGGNPLDICGGGNRINIYENTTWTESDAPTPNPGLVPKVDNFENIGCYFDSTTARVLRADNTQDASSSGMTVEKCVKYAQDNHWRYAGVQFGIECYIGNTLRGAEDAPQRDCNMACAGNSQQLCGSGNRIQVYEDKTWKDPTKDEMNKLIRDYYEIMVESGEILREMEALLEEYQGLQVEGSRSRVRARVDPIGRSSAIRDGLGLLRNRGAGLINRVDAYEMDLIRGATQYTRLDVDVAGGVTRAELEALAEGVRHAGPQFRAAQAAVQRFLASGTFSVADALLVVKASVISFGITIPLEISVPAAGIGIIGIVVKFFQAVNGIFTSPTLVVPTPPSPTTTPSSSSSAIPTEIVLLMDLKSSQSDYNNVIEEIRKEPGNTLLSKINTPKGRFRSLTAQLTDKVITSLIQNPKVATLSLRAQADPGVSRSSGPIFKRKPNSKHQKRDWTPPAGYEHWWVSQDLRVGSRSIFQDPRQLSWLTAPWAMRQAPATSGRSFYDFKAHVYDSRPATARKVRTYVLDYAAKRDHQEYENRLTRFDATHLVPDTTTPGVMTRPSSPQPPSDNNEAGKHGTCMASCAGGEWVGSFKNASLVSIKLSAQNQYPYLDDVLYALDIVTRDMQDTDSYYGVLSMSFGFTLEEMRVRDGQTKYDPFAHLLAETFLTENKLVAVMSSGNYEDERLTERTPRTNGGRDTPLIVIGNANLDGSRYIQSTYLDDDNKGILTAYAMGVMIHCANPQDTNDYHRDTGSSPATATTAGYISLMLARGTPGWSHTTAKQMLIQEAENFKGTAWVSDNPSNPEKYPSKPRVAMGSGLIPCSPAPNPLPVASMPNYQNVSTTENLELSSGRMTPAPFTELIYDDEPEYSDIARIGIGTPPSVVDPSPPSDGDDDNDEPPPSDDDEPGPPSGDDEPQHTFP